MSLQETIDNIALRLSVVSEQLGKGLDEVRGKIAELEANSSESVDFSAVNAALDAVSFQAQSLDNVVPDVVTDEVVEEPVEEVVAEEVSTDSETPTENV